MGFNNFIISERKSVKVQWSLAHTVPAASSLTCSIIPLKFGPNGADCCYHFISSSSPTA